MTPPELADKHLDLWFKDGVSVPGDGKLTLRERVTDAIKEALEKQEADNAAGHATIIHERDVAQAEVARLKSMSTIEMMCENFNVRYHVAEWEARCLTAEAEVARLQGVVDRAIKQ